MRESIQFNTGTWLLARHMTIATYAQKIIQIETGLSYKQVKKVRDSLAAEGVEFCKKSRSVRGSCTLIASYPAKIQASVLMQFYIGIGGESVFSSVDRSALEKAFYFYQAVHNEISDPSDKRWKPFEITDAWCLAVELRRNIATVELCKSCECTFFVSANQMISSTCPFCKCTSNKPPALDKPGFD